MRVALHVQPRSRRIAVGGSHGGALTVRVRQPAEGGRATAEALTALAEALGVPSRDVSLISGRTSRTKIVEIPDRAESRYAELRDGTDTTQHD